MKTVIFIPISLIVTLNHADAIVLTFDDPPVISQDSYGNGDIYTEQGFTFTTSRSFGSIIRFNPEGISFLPNNGSIHFGATGTANPTMAIVGDQTFRLRSIDFARYSDILNTSSVLIRGNFSAGFSFIETIKIEPDFSTHTFSDQWQNLKSIDFLSTGMSWDNVVVDVIPEPSSALCFSFGLLLISRNRRR